MFIPDIYQMTNRDAILAFMNRYPFAIMVTASGEEPIATHIPFTVIEREGKIILRSHVAAANLQWKHITGGGSLLVIFSEPHAYISPRNYTLEKNVPTWNYVAVHAYGTGYRIEQESVLLEMMEEMIRQYDPEYIHQWERLPMEYKHKMIKGLVAFEIEVTRIEAKEKLSQNKTHEEQHRIIEDLEQSDSPTTRDLARYMKENKRSH